MMEEISITLVNSLVFSAIVFFPLKLTGDFIIFWLIFLTTTSIGIGELTHFDCLDMPLCSICIVL